MASVKQIPDLTAESEGLLVAGARVTENLS
jgi:hypothetical protein